MKRLAAIYLLAIAVLIAARLKFGSKGSEMVWSDVTEVTVPAKPKGVWTWSIDYVKGPVRILVEADVSGKWSYSPEGSCGPDGDLTALLTSANALLPSAPVGALIMKIGGSTAGSADGVVRVAGSKAYFEIDKNVAGPLFLTINDEPGGMVDNSGELKVKVSLSPLASPVTAPRQADAGGDEAPEEKPASDATERGTKTGAQEGGPKSDAPKTPGSGVEPPKTESPKTAAPKPQTPPKEP